jgi:glycerophosphoryl diester phosphodiesterase
MLPCARKIVLGALLTVEAVDAHGGSVLRAIVAAGGKAWSPNYRNLTPERLAEAQALGLRVYPWTVNDTATMARLIDLGVDGITANRLYARCATLRVSA